MTLLVAFAVSVVLHISVLLAPLAHFEIEAPSDGIDDLPPVQVQLRANRPAVARAVPAKPKSMKQTSPTPVTPQRPDQTPPPPQETSAPEPEAEALPEPPPPVAAVEAPAAAPPVRLPLPAFGEARYGVTRGDKGFVIGRAELRWSHDGAHYEASSVVETTGLAALVKSVKVTQISRGRVDGSGLLPEEFRSEQPKRSLVARIDRAAGTVKNGEREAPLGAWAGNVQDLLSMTYQLRLLLQQPQLPESLDLPIATGRKLALYRILVVGREPLEVAGRQFEAVRVSAKNADDLIEFWFAPTALEVPLRIRYTDRSGDTYEQTLESITREEHS